MRTPKYHKLCESQFCRHLFGNLRLAIVRQMPLKHRHHLFRVCFHIVESMQLR